MEDEQNLDHPIQETPSQQSSTSTTSQPVYKNKVFLGFVAISFLLAFLIGGYVLGKNQSKPSTPVTEQTPTPTPDPTANWKTHTYKYSGGTLYSIKYPSDWTALQNESLVRFFPPGVEIKNGLGPNKESEHVEIHMSSFDPKSCRGDCLYSPQVSVSNLADLDLGKYKTSEGQMGTMCDCQVDKFYLENNDTFYTIGLYGLSYTNQAPPSISKESEQIFKLMLTTLKFTNSTSDTTNWKTYSGQLYTLKYPDNWTTIENQDEFTIYPSGYPFKAPGEPASTSPYLRFSIVNAVGRGIEPIKQTAVTISNQETVKYYEAETQGVIKAVNTPDNRLLSITFQLPSNDTTIDTQFDKILSTFKFTQ